MAGTWIVHRDERRRAAIARLAGLQGDVLAGAPGDPAFATAASPRVVVLGLAGDFETELEFAHREAPRRPGARWILLAEPRDRAEAERLFDALTAEILTYPPAADLLSARVRAAGRSRPVERLSDRRQRDALSERFSRWFGDLELPDLLRALDPRLAGVPLLVRGERGSGRALLAQYVHTFGGSTGGAFAFVPCADATSPEELLALLRLAGEGSADRQGLTVCLEDADRLARAMQQELRRWTEFGPPAGTVRATRLRWMATVQDDEDGVMAPGFTRELAQALAGISVRIPPLRERPDSVERFTHETARAWCAAHGEETPELGLDAVEALREYPWPGNLRELEAVVVRTLAAGVRSPLREEALRFDGTPDGTDGGMPGARDGTPREAAYTYGAPGEAFSRAPDATPRLAPSGSASETPLAPPSEAAEPADTTAAEGPEIRRLIRALGHELRNPLAAVRTFTDLLPHRYDDEEFRERFREAVRDDVHHVEEVVKRLASFAEIDETEPESVDLTRMLEEILEEHQSEKQSRRLLVLKEFEAERPEARGRRGALRFIFESVLDRALSWVPDRGNLYVASRHHPEGLRGAPSLRVLIRFVRPSRSALASPIETEAARDVSERENSLDLLLAELRVRAEGGSLAVSGPGADETVIVVDLPAG